MCQHRRLRAEDVKDPLECRPSTVPDRIIFCSSVSDAVSCRLELGRFAVLRRV